MGRLIIKISTLFIATVLAACATEPKVVEFKSTADPQIELAKLDASIQEAGLNQINILSPKNYKLVVEYEKKAVAAQASTKDQKTTLHLISVANAYLIKAQLSAETAKTILRPVVEARQDAVSANAVKFVRRDMERSDSELVSSTERFENNDAQVNEKSLRKLEAAYHKHELDAILIDNLGLAKSNLALATKEGAPKLTPETLAWANTQIKNDEATIVTNRHSPSQIEAAALNATAASNRLLKMVRDAKSYKGKDPEQLAKDIEHNDIERLQSEDEQSQAAKDLASSRKEATQAKALNTNLESEVWLNNEFDKASQEFTSNEAEVYKQGDKLLLRLKGLSFANNKSEVVSKDYALLAKVQQVIREIGPSQVEISGHTDSVGSKALNEELSTQRAKAIQAYLITNNNVPSEEITAVGYGFSKPIATNKTALGRAQNRRVDVTIAVQRD